MLIDLVGRYATEAVLPPDTGSLAGDLRAVAEDAINVLKNPLVRNVIRALVAERRRSPDLDAVITEKFIEPRRAAGAAMFQRAMDRGEIAPDSDPEMAQDMFGGPLYFKGVILDEDFPTDFAQRLTDGVLRSLGAVRLTR